MRLLLLGLVAACSSSATDDVVGPFTGETHRFVADRITIPRDTAQADMFAADLDGDGVPENQFAFLAGLLARTSDLTVETGDMIASGALASSIEIQADDLVEDPTVGVRYLGADGDMVTLAGGRIEAGAFRSNRTSLTRAPGRATVRLPVFTNADPLIVELDGMELDLGPDGAGGFDGIVRGGIREAAARDAVYLGLVEMLMTEPERHIVFARAVDPDRDGVVSQQEVSESLLWLLLVADVQLFDGSDYAPVPDSNQSDSVSIGFGVHLSPCPTGRCSTTAPVVMCRDRVRDGDETDVDCGGSCQTCAADLACSVPADCQSGACDAGRCRAPSCSDGVRSGFESDIDCGGVCGAVCQLGQMCAAEYDCASGNCDAGLGAIGVCVMP